MDILPAAMFHAHDTTAAASRSYDETTWCSSFTNEIGASDVELEAFKGFNGKNKCTWQLSVPAGEGTKGLSIQLT